MFDYFEEYEDSCDTEIELDVIGICCEFSEYDSAIDCIETAGYGYEFDEDHDEEEREEDALEFLQNNTQVIVFDSGIIIQDY